MNKPYRESELEQAVLNPVRQTTMQFWLVLGGLGIVFLWGAVMLIRQWVLGLGVTGLNRPIYWGIYLTNFVFFIGISHAGTLISAILRVTQAEWRRPITRVAEAITFFALIFICKELLLFFISNTSPSSSTNPVNILIYPLKPNTYIIIKYFIFYIL